MHAWDCRRGRCEGIGASCCSDCIPSGLVGGFPAAVQDAGNETEGWRGHKGPWGSVLQSCDGQHENQRQAKRAEAAEWALSQLCTRLLGLRGLQQNTAPRRGAPWRGRLRWPCTSPAAPLPEVSTQGSPAGRGHWPPFSGRTSGLRYATCLMLVRQAELGSGPDPGLAVPRGTSPFPGPAGPQHTQVQPLLHTWIGLAWVRQTWPHVLATCHS